MPQRACNPSNCTVLLPPRSRANLVHDVQIFVESDVISVSCVWLNRFINHPRILV